jgi:hypothetical protein
MDSPIYAFLLVILGGVLQGSFILPMKLTPNGNGKTPGWSIRLRVS